MHRLRGAQFVLIFVFLWQTTARASDLDVIGVTLLRTVTTNLNGTNIRVGQAEAGAPNWEVNPGVVGQPTNRFTYFYGTSPYSSVSLATAFTNSLGLESSHADMVAGNCYGLSGGVATNVVRVDNYEANTVINYYVNQGHLISGRVMNQSFASDTYNPTLDQIYDNYAASNGVLFVTGAQFNGAPIASPATCYNGIGVGVSDAPSPPPPYGPTPDGRSKPDIAAPGQFASYTTAYVSGAAVLLIQAGLRGDGGGGGATNAAVDLRTVKALLLNGAIKPADWTNSTFAPLDIFYGAGVLNVFNSYKQLAGGRHGFIVSTGGLTNSPHPPTGATGTVSGLSGWDFNTNSTSARSNVVNHYYFNVTNGVSNATFTATITLVWNRHRTNSLINNLDLFLYDARSSNLVTCSTSRVDNVEHIFVPHLPPGRYDLQVFKSGGATVTTNEPYALAYEFFSMGLNVARSGTNAVLKWPIYPAGFILESTANLIPPVVWSASNPAPGVTNNQNIAVLNAAGPNRFFRLRRP